MLLILPGFPAGPELARPAHSAAAPGSYHRGMTLARDERLALCALLDETGPDAPTLCEGWTTRDLAAHLVLRENRKDAGIGILGGPLAGYTRRVQRRLSEQVAYSDLVTTIRNGPPGCLPSACPG